MDLTERELERYGERFIMSFEAIRRALNLYPTNHPNVGRQLERFMKNLEELRASTGEAMVNLAKGEFFVNGVPLKRLSISYQGAIRSWEEKGVGLIAFGTDMTADSVLLFFQSLGQSVEEIEAAGGIASVLESAGVTGIRAGKVTVGVQADEVMMIDADEDDSVEIIDLDVETAHERYQESFGRLLTAIQAAATVDVRVRVVRNLSQIIESRLLERHAVRDLGGKLRRHDKESYRHALGGAVAAVLIGSALGLEPRRLRLLGEAALLRDVGKMELPVEVLRQPDGHDARRASYQTHPELGAKMLLGHWEIDPTAAIVAHEHHAGHDLSGFPTLGRRRALHPFTRVVAVASDYDRMTGGYPGVETVPIWEAVGALVRGVGSTYDPAAVRGMLRIVGCVPEGTPVKLLDGREGIVSGPGRSTWLAPDVAILRDVAGEPVEPPEIVATDGLAPPGESVVQSYMHVTELDRDRLDVLLEDG